MPFAQSRHRGGDQGASASCVFDLMVAAPVAVRVTRDAYKRKLEFKLDPILLGLRLPGWPDDQTRSGALARREPECRSRNDTRRRMPKSQIRDDRTVPAPSRWLAVKR